MLRRVPLWLTLVPLALAIGLYWLLWSGWARDFEAMVEGEVPAAGAVAVTGFPYRLETALVSPTWTAGDGVKIVAGADRAIVNRGPWAPELTVIRADYAKVSAIVGPGFGASLTGKSALVSVKIDEGRLARLSAVVEAAKARLGFAPVAVMADVLELHMRERIPASDSSDSATLPARGQLVAKGQRLRFDGGDALTFAADMTANGAGRLTDFNRWAQDGTIEVTSLTLADAHGDVAKVAATLVPVGRTALRFAGTVETVCPANVIAAFEGRSAVAEMRLRAPVRVAFDGLAGSIRLSGVPTDLAGRARRGQDPACPVIRGPGG
ncbi:DUF2125 domain-containing protein [Polymorphobacter fuscus]|uniref:DUF2125 domain-containing protein n=1 Tax=Sandarakinorhabdus fusca TaxID=1439888 RepID=A0A7C9GZG9_9SPHN|nr:DUF2125 domain-containing protein [Polymorphobacter fuscus]KAB7643891.1 DUF2125 domain-containing protein [Polymorphobacter fuscus]MQT18594.1 hypothetical protein [Polymorphobacter fuscus]NJC07038.1 hypothetical protein [Polymorphobacter fuscus]